MEKNDYFQDSIKNQDLKHAFERKIKELYLRDSDTQEPIGREMAEKILEECDKLIDGIDIEIILRKEKGVYSNYISSLIVKLVLAYGLKNAAIRKLRIKDYNDQLNDLIINNYRVRLPDGLAMQMKKYQEIRKKFLGKYEIKSERLFFDDYDVDKELYNTKMFIVLKKVMGNMQATIQCAVFKGRGNFYPFCTASYGRFFKMPKMNAKNRKSFVVFLFFCVLYIRRLFNLLLNTILQTRFALYIESYCCFLNVITNAPLICTDVAI